MSGRSLVARCFSPRLPCYCGEIVLPIECRLKRGTTNPAEGRSKTCPTCAWMACRSFVARCFSPRLPCYIGEIVLPIECRLKRGTTNSADGRTETCPTCAWMACRSFVARCFSPRLPCYIGEIVLPMECRLKRGTTKPADGRSDLPYLLGAASVRPGRNTGLMRLGCAGTERPARRAWVRRRARAVTRFTGRL